MAQLRPQAPHQLRRELGNVHSLGDDKLAAQDGPRLVVILQLAIDAAILALLIPAESPVWNRLRTDELEAAQERVPFGHEKRLPKNGYLDEPFVRSKDFRHEPPHRLLFEGLLHWPKS
jgi:hypothetical protein